MPNDQKTAAAHLQAQTDRLERASERIDKDPEEALNAIERAGARADVSAGAITVQDMFSLFGQMQSQMNAIMERQAAQQEQLIAVLTNQQAQQGRSKADTQKELEEAALQQRMTLEAWNTESREPVYLTPELSEEKVAAAHEGKFPPRVFRINGLEYPVVVNEVVSVPSSVAAVIRHSQRQRPLQRSPQDIPQIPDPQRGQFLVGAEQVSAGQAGKTGEGRLIPAPVAASPEFAQPLDQRYDAWGR